MRAERTDSDIIEDIEAIEEEQKNKEDFEIEYDGDNMAVDIEEDEELLDNPETIEEEELTQTPQVADTIPVMRQSMELQPPSSINVNKFPKPSSHQVQPPSSKTTQTQPKT